MSSESVASPKIVVGVDASPAAEAALRWAIEYARKVGAEVVVVHAYEIPVSYADPYSAAMPTMLEPAFRDSVRRRFEEDWCAPLAAADLPHRTVMEDGTAARVLVDVAEREAAELIVTGRRGLNALGELVLGSVSHELTHCSKLPVVLVPADHRAAA
jgi:nucleotide-binding universal stress UspA family protein